MRFKELLNAFEKGEIKRGSPLFVVAHRISGDHEVHCGVLNSVRADEKSHQTFVGHNPVKLSDTVSLLGIENGRILPSGETKFLNPRRATPHEYFTTEAGVKKFLKPRIDESPMIKKALLRFFAEVRQR